MLWKKEIEDGSASEVSTPIAGVRVAVIPLSSAAFQRAGGGALDRAQVLRLVADDDDAVEGAEVAAGAREEVAADDLGQGAAADQLAADADAERGQRVGVVARCRRSGSWRGRRRAR